MKFSLKTLVLVVLFAALCINAIRLAERSARFEYLTIDNRSQIGPHAEELNDYREQDFLNRRSYVEQSLANLQIGSRNLITSLQEELNGVGQLKVNPDEFSVIYIPDDSTRNQSYRVYVPATKNLALRSVVGEDLSANRFVSSEYPYNSLLEFQSTSQRNIPLPAGESTVSFKFTPAAVNPSPKRNASISIFINGECKSIREIKEGHDYGFTTSIPRCVAQCSFQDPTSVQLFDCFSEPPSEQTLNVSIVSADPGMQAKQ